MGGYMRIILLVIINMVFGIMSCLVALYLTFDILGFAGSTSASDTLLAIVIVILFLSLHFGLNFWIVRKLFKKNVIIYCLCIIIFSDIFFGIATPIFISNITEHTYEKDREQKKIEFISSQPVLKAILDNEHLIPSPFILNEKLIYKYGYRDFTSRFLYLPFNTDNRSGNSIIKKEDFDSLVNSLNSIYKNKYYIEINNFSRYYSHLDISSEPEYVVLVNANKQYISCTPLENDLCKELDYVYPL